MAKQSDNGRKVRCSKCGKSFYDLGKKTKTCPACEVAALIPDGEIATVRMKIQSGRHNDFDHGWTGGFASRNDGGSVFLKCHFEILNGKHRGKTFSSLIGLHSPKGPWWGNEGRKTLREMLNSANGLSDKDYSGHAVQSRRVESFSAFDGLSFLAEISRKKGTDGVTRNELKRSVGPDDPIYEERMGGLEALSELNSAHYAAAVNASPSTSGPKEQPLWLERVR